MRVFRSKHRNLIASSTLSLLILAVEPMAQEVATITLRDGTVYETVLYEVCDSTRSISFEYAETKRTVCFEQVRRIIDVSGGDITGTILEDCTERALQEAYQMRDDRRPKPLRLPWTIGLNIGFNYCMTSGDYYDGTQPAIGFGGDFILAAGSTGAVKLSISKAGIKSEVGDRWFLDLETGDIYELHNVTLSAWRFFLCLEAYHPLSIIKDKPTILTAEVGFGAILHRIGADLTWYEYIWWKEAYEEGLTTHLSSSDTRYATTLGAGIIQKVKPGYGIYGNIACDLVHLRGSYIQPYETPSRGSFALNFNLQCGLAFFFD
jgi:hypothetical protein